MLICADSRAALAEIEEGSVQCCITSPPYWGLRRYGDAAEMVFGGDPQCDHVFSGEVVSDIREDAAHGKTRTTDRFYGDESRRFDGNHQKHVSTQFCSLCGCWRGQFGLEPTPEMYVEHTLEFLRAIWRVLRDDGVLFLNLGDSYAGAGDRRGGKGDEHGQGKKWATSAESIGLKPKDLCGIPWRVVLAAQADGWYWRQVVPWLKRNPMPESTDDRPTTAHEYFFMLTKSGKPTYWTHRDRDGVRKRPKADYRWQNQLTGEEVSEAPDDWKQVVKCPDCQDGEIIHEQWGVSWAVECERCKGKGTVQLWKRVNLWRGHDYYWDADAIRMPGTSGPSDIRKMVEKKDRIGGKHKTLDDPLSKASASTNIGRKRAVGNPSGRNRRTTDWFYESIRYILEGGEQMLVSPEGDPLALCVNTRPYKGSHYATFPPGLILPMILAGTSQKVCAECGAGWERVTERETKEPNYRKGNRPETEHAYWGESNTRTLAMVQDVHTLGFRPTCSCGDMVECERCHGTGIDPEDEPEMACRYCLDAGYQPETKPPKKAIILDPFCGRGTVLKEARAHGRDWIGIDVDPQSIKLAEEWLNLGDVTYEIDEEHWIQPRLGLHA